MFLLLLWIMVACDTAAPVVKTPPASPLLGRYSYTPAASQRPSGTLIFADSQFPLSVNPLFASSPVDFEVRDALWAAPVFYDQQFHIHADQLTEVPLPENGDVQDHGRTIIMHLRHDLHWSDGQPLLASDFQYWWHLNQDPNTGAILTTGYDQIASVDTPDQYTVVLHMRQPFGPYLSYLPYAAPQHAWQQFHPIDLQNTASVYQAPAVTDGPYLLTHYVDGQSYTLAPNPHYASTTFHGPFLSQLIFRAVPGVAALARQQTDVTQGYMEYDLPLLRHLPPGVRLLITPAASYEHLDFNNANPFLQDLRVRQAIQMAIDICGLIKDVLHAPTCDRRTSQVELPPSLVYDSSISPSVYDPAAAKKLLAQAGWQLNAQGKLSKNGRPFTLRLATTANNPLRAAVAAHIRQYLRAIGIAVNIISYPRNSFFGLYTKGGILATGAFDLALFTYANGPDPDDEYTAFHSSQIPTSDQPDLSNYAHIRDPLIDNALTQARNTVVFADRLKFYHQFLERLASQVYFIPLYADVNILTVSVRVQNVLPNANQADNNWNIADWWVKD